MVDGVLLLVDAVEGPMPQTRFVTRKALAAGLKPIVVINKIDRPGARPDWVINATFDLFDKLGATEDQLDFPVIYASALNGYAGLTDDVEELQKIGNMRAVFDAVIKYVPVREDDAEAPLQLQICSLDYSSYVGKIGIGRVHRGTLKAGQSVMIMNGPDDTPKPAKINQIMQFEGLDKKIVESAQAGDIVLVNGIEELNIGTTITDPAHPEALPMLSVDEPTLTMSFMVNTSPLAGREGKFVTSRQIRERLELYYETVKAVIDENVAASTGKMEDAEVINGDVHKFDNFIWYGADTDFERVDDTTFTLNTSVSGILGIDHTFESGDNKADIYVDGELYKSPTVTFNYDFSQRHIMVVSDDCTVEKEIKVVFNSKEQADGFQGMCYSVRKNVKMRRGIWINRFKKYRDY